MPSSWRRDATSGFGLHKGESAVVRRLRRRKQNEFSRDRIWIDHGSPDTTDYERETLREKGEQGKVERSDNVDHATCGHHWVFTGFLKGGGGAEREEI